MKFQIKFCVFCLLLVTATSAKAAIFNYSGTITEGSGPLVLLMPVGFVYHGVFDINAPGADLTSDDPAIINSITFTMTNTITGATSFCFRYNAICGAGEKSVDIVQISLDLAFNVLNEPASGIIQLTAFPPTFAPFDITLNLGDGIFVLNAIDTGLGEVSGVGSFDTTPVPVPASLWLLLSAGALLTPQLSSRSFRTL